MHIMEPERLLPPNAGLKSLDGCVPRLMGAFLVNGRYSQPGFRRFTNRQGSDSPSRISPWRDVPTMILDSIHGAITPKTFFPKRTDNTAGGNRGAVLVGLWRAMLINPYYQTPHKTPGNRLRSARSAKYQHPSSTERRTQSRFAAQGTLFGGHLNC